jgi:hypothetical protein
MGFSFTVEATAPEKNEKLGAAGGAAALAEGAGGIAAELATDAVPLVGGAELARGAELALAAAAVSDGSLQPPTTRRVNESNGVETSVRMKSSLG